MKLNFMPDDILIKKIKSHTRDERMALTRFLDYLYEIDRRKLFSALGFKSLFDFMIRYLGYPEDQAYRRLTALRLVKDLPEIKDKINSGDINLTHINLVQSHLRQEQKISKKILSKNDKWNIINKISNTTVRDAERIIFSLSSVAPNSKPDSIKLISQDLVEIRFTAPIHIQSKLEKLTGLNAHKKPHLSLGDLFDDLCNLGLETWDPAKFAAHKKRRGKLSPDNANLIGGAKSQGAIRRSVFKNASGICVNCGSVYALEIDHIIPRAKGGTSHQSNLRVLCKSCNQRAAIEEFGLKKMDTYLN